MESIEVVKVFVHTYFLYVLNATIPALHVFGTSFYAYKCSTFKSDMHIVIKSIQTKVGIVCIYLHGH